VECGVTNTREISDNVWSFIDRVSQLYGRMHAERWRQNMHATCVECGPESPIEDMFWIALNALCDAHFIETNPEPDDDGRDKCGLYIYPQRTVGQYRVDFLLTFVGYVQGDANQLVIGSSSVIVELDGHDFHDKDKRQRSYEKKRDRDLQRAGYKVLHFTGSDVVKDPFSCAHEAMDLIGADWVMPFDQANPLGLDDA
jgi:hypothetical protein